MVPPVEGLSVVTLGAGAPKQSNEGMTVTNLARSISGVVDAHLDVDGAAALDERGALLRVESFATTETGFELLGSLSDFGPVELVGVEGTGSMEPGSLVISKPS